MKNEIDQLKVELEQSKDKCRILEQVCLGLESCIGVLKENRELHSAHRERKLLLIMARFRTVAMLWHGGNAHFEASTHQKQSLEDHSRFATWGAPTTPQEFPMAIGLEWELLLLREYSFAPPFQCCQLDRLIFYFEAEIGSSFLGCA
eukprot:4508456-Amphidinium_carterae.2